MKVCIAVFGEMPQKMCLFRKKGLILPQRSCQNESRFSLSSDSHRILIWRERRSHNHPSNIIERDRYGGRGVLVWVGIMLGSRTDLHIIDAGSVNGTRYCNEILLPYVRLFRGAMGLQFLLMDDNAPCYRTVAAEQLLESEDIERMDWPARSPDLTPIENVWEFLGRRLAARTLPPVTIRELRLARQDEWAAMPQQLIDNLILSMGRRCETCLAAGLRAVLLVRWIVRSVPLEIVGSSGHEKVPTRGNPGLQQPGRQRGERIVRQALVDPTMTRSTIREDVGVAIVP
ncbi:transposable element Tcb1 transposase [Trichonephila clavipes]|nr:transposable element Tcb1 transposase [Trichonephila clavipes]